MKIENQMNSPESVNLFDIKNGRTFRIVGDHNLYMRVSSHKLSGYSTWFNAINLLTGDSAVVNNCQCILTNHVAVEK